MSSKFLDLVEENCVDTIKIIRETPLETLTKEDAKSLQSKLTQVIRIVKRLKKDPRIDYGFFTSSIKRLHEMSSLVKRRAATLKFQGNAGKTRGSITTLFQGVEELLEGSKILGIEVSHIIVKPKGLKVISTVFIIFGLIDLATSIFVFFTSVQTAIPYLAMAMIAFISAHGLYGLKEWSMWLGTASTLISILRGVFWTFSLLFMMDVGIILIALNAFVLYYLMTNKGYFVL